MPVLDDVASGLKSVMSKLPYAAAKALMGHPDTPGELRSEIVEGALRRLRDQEQTSEVLDKRWVESATVEPPRFSGALDEDGWN